MRGQAATFPGTGMMHAAPTQKPAAESILTDEEAAEDTHGVYLYSWFEQLHAACVFRSSVS